MQQLEYFLVHFELFLINDFCTYSHPNFKCCGSGIGDPVLFLPLDPGSGMGKNPEPGFGMNTILFLRTQYEFFGLKILKFLYADPDPASCQPWILDPG
jgi:hypothetical protein